MDAEPDRKTINFIDDRPVVVLSEKKQVLRVPTPPSRGEARRLIECVVEYVGDKTVVHYGTPDTLSGRVPLEALAEKIDLGEIPF